MKSVGLISPGVLFLLLLTFGPAYAQQEQHGENARAPKQDQQQKQEPRQQRSQPQQRAQQQPRQQQSQPQQRAQQQPRQQQSQPQQRAQQQRAQQQPRQASRPSPQGQRVQQAEERSVWQQHRARSWQADQRTWEQRGGYNGYRVPEATFYSDFGRDHGFASIAIQCLLLGGIPASSTAAFGSVSLTRGRNTGRTIGTKPTTCTSTIPMTDITSTTRGTPAPELQSASPSTNGSSNASSISATNSKAPWVCFNFTPAAWRRTYKCFSLLNLKE